MDGEVCVAGWEGAGIGVGEGCGVDEIDGGEEVVCGPGGGGGGCGVGAVAEYNGGGGH